MSIIYLSGISPSLPAKAPRHQSLLTCVYNVKVSPFLKLSSLSDLALKSNCAVASRFSDSIDRKQIDYTSWKIFFNSAMSNILENNCLTVFGWVNLRVHVFLGLIRRRISDIPKLRIISVISVAKQQQKSKRYLKTDKKIATSLMSLLEFDKYINLFLLTRRRVLCWCISHTGCPRCPPGRSPRKTWWCSW